jgi:hypothetical protein
MNVNQQNTQPSSVNLQGFVEDQVLLFASCFQIRGIRVNPPLNISSYA